MQFHLVRAPWTSRIWALEHPVDIRSSSAVNRDPGTHLHDWALRSFPPINRCRNFIKSFLHLCRLYCTIQVLREFFFFPCKREGRKVPYALKVKKSEEPHLRVLLFSSGAPSESSGSNFFFFFLRQKLDFHVKVPVCKHIYEPNETEQEKP